MSTNEERVVYQSPQRRRLNATGSASAPLSPNSKPFEREAGMKFSPASHSNLNKSPLSSPTMAHSPSSSLYKTQICRSFNETGSCPYNVKCLFAHGAGELRKPDGPRRPSVNEAIVNLQTRTSPVSSTNNVMFGKSAAAVEAGAPRIWINTDRSGSVSSAKSEGKDKAKIDAERAAKLFKTELCRLFVESNACPYGSKCQFAHGEEELRPLERPKKYKTENCQKFQEEGICPFGSRCIFIHDEDERELPNSPVFDAEYASKARQRRISTKSEAVWGIHVPSSPMRVSADAGLTGEFLKLRMSPNANEGQQQQQQQQEAV